MDPDVAGDASEVSLEQKTYTKQSQIERLGESGKVSQTRVDLKKLLSLAGGRVTVQTVVKHRKVDSSRLNESLRDRG
jgi:hypothetical protein